MYAVDGKIKVLTNKTGHYLSDEHNLWQVLDELKSRGISLSGIKVVVVSGGSMSGGVHYAGDEFYAAFAPGGASVPSGDNAS